MNYPEDFKNKVIQGNCSQVMKQIPDNSIDTIITSPPYWALRDYGVEGQLGLETTFQEYITKLCNIFDEVKRVLKKEGTCWVNIGDTYSGNMGKRNGWTDNKLGFTKQGAIDKGVCLTSKNKFKYSLPNKCLIQIPSRFAIEMCNRGWILRNEIIWHKPNCMPSSATDRFTIDFEKIFFFVKGKRYYFEQQLEKAIWAEKDYRSLIKGGVLSGGKTATGKYATKRVAYSSKRVKENVKFFGEGSGNPGNGIHGSTLGGITPNMEMGLKNKRTVWTINTKGFTEAHFATYPETLVKPMILAGCPEQGIVLDPFIGSGTTAVVAKKLGRNYIGIDINKDYCEIARQRLRQEVLPI